MINRTVIFGDEGTPYTVYGIDVIDLSGHILKTAKDIFFDEKQAENFAIRCNQEKISLTHFDDVIEDIIVNQYTLAE